MLLAVLIVLACFNVAVSDDYSPYPQASDGYQQQSGYPIKVGGSIYDVDDGDDIIKEIRDLAKNASILFENNKDIGQRITSLSDENGRNNEFTDVFEDQLYVTIRERQRHQAGEIAELETQAEALLGLSEDIANAGKSIDELRHQLDEISEESKAIQQDVAELQKIEQDQDKRTTDAIAQLTKQEDALTKLETASSAVSEKLSIIRNILTEVADIIRLEAAIHSVQVIVPTGCVVESVLVVEDINKVHYGISEIRIEDRGQTYAYRGAPAYGSTSYGYSPVIDKPSVSFDVDVVYDGKRNVVTTSLTDHSTGGWSVTQVTVDIIVAYSDNRLISLDKLDDYY